MTRVIVCLSQTKVGNVHETKRGAGRGFYIHSSEVKIILPIILKALSDAKMLTSFDTSSKLERGRLNRYRRKEVPLKGKLVEKIR
jgi:hypothetical protein